MFGTRAARSVALTVFFATALLLVPTASSAAKWTSTPKGKWHCEKSGNGCVSHTGFNPNQGDHWGQARNSKGNCTKYAAYRLIKNGASDPGFRGSGGAKNWAKVVRDKLGAKRVNGTPAVGAIAWYSYGHVAYVEKIVKDDVYLSDSSYPTRPGIGGSSRKIVKGDSPDAYLHIKDKPKRPKPKDRDKDGVPDNSDRCPNTKGSKSNHGCPLPEKPKSPVVTSPVTPESMFDHVTPLGPTSGPAGFGLKIGMPMCTPGLTFNSDGSFFYHAGWTGGPTNTMVIDTSQGGVLSMGPHQLSFACEDSLGGNREWVDQGFVLTVTGPPIPTLLQSSTVPAGGNIVFLTGPSAGAQPCPAMPGFPISLLRLALFPNTGGGLAADRTVQMPDGNTSESLPVPASTPAGNYTTRQECIYFNSGSSSSSEAAYFVFLPQSVTIS